MTKTLRAGEDITVRTDSPTASTAVSHAQEALHSPLPWRTDAMAQYVWAKDSAGTFPVLMLRGWGHFTGTGGLNLSEDEAVAIQEANAAFIVRACNHHEALLAALKAMSVAFNAAMFRREINAGTENSDIANAAHAAITNAEGK